MIECCSNDYILYCMIIINVVLTLQVSTTCLSHDRDPREIKAVFNHTCSLHTCICAWGVQEASTPIGSCRRGNATMLGVSQVTLFCSGLCRTELTQKKIVSDSPEVNLNVTKQLFQIFHFFQWFKLDLVKMAKLACDHLCQCMRRMRQHFASVCCAQGSTLLAHTVHMVAYCQRTRRMRYHNCVKMGFLQAYAAHAVASCQRRQRMRQQIASICFAYCSNLLAYTVHTEAICQRTLRIW